MEYKIKRILHSGSKGTRGTDKTTDSRYQPRIGRTVDLDLDNIFVDYPIRIPYIKDSDGSDYRGHFLYAGYLNNSIGIINNTVIIETFNSIYEFEKVYK